MSVKDKLEKQGPRKLLALDGGGIRGVMTLEVLAKIESELPWAFQSKVLRKEWQRSGQFVQPARENAAALLMEIVWYALQ